MQRTRVIWILASIIVAVMIGFFAGSQRHSGDQSGHVMATYQVSPDHADEARYNLNKLFWQKENEPLLGVAQVFGNGLMVVRTSRSLQRGVESLIREMEKEKPQARSVVRLDYWLVTGEDATKSNLESFPHLNSVLSAIDKLDGPKKFRVLEHLGTNSKSGQEVEVQGSNAKVKSVANLSDNLVGLNLDFKAQSLGSIKSTTFLKPGEFVVLGQNAVPPTARFNDVKFPENVSLYYIVHAEVVK